MDSDTYKNQPTQNKYLLRSKVSEKKIEERNNAKTKECADDKILNPLTGRCVKKSGSIGKKLLEINRKIKLNIDQDENEDEDEIEDQDEIEDEIEDEDNKADEKEKLTYTKVYMKNNDGIYGNMGVVIDPETIEYVQVMSEKGREIIERYGNKKDKYIIEIADKNEEVKKMLNNFTVWGDMLEIYNDYYKKNIDILYIAGVFKVKTYIKEIEPQINIKEKNAGEEEIRKMIKYMGEKYKNDICEIDREYSLKIIKREVYVDKKDGLKENIEKC